MFERFVDIICNYVEVEAEDVQMDSRFIEDLGFTSFDFMTMLGDLEDEFDIEIDQTEVSNVRTVGEALEYMESIGGK
jgi:acyl carrier protein